MKFLINVKDDAVIAEIDKRLTDQCSATKERKAFLEKQLKDLRESHQEVMDKEFLAMADRLVELGLIEGYDSKDDSEYLSINEEQQVFLVKRQSNPLDELMRGLMR